jgi:hypothetical protein
LVNTPLTAPIRASLHRIRSLLFAAASLALSLLPTAAIGEETV